MGCSREVKSRWRTASSILRRNPIVAETYAIEAQTRTIFGKKCAALRRQGLVPAVVYGPKIEPLHVQIPYRALQLALLKAGGTHLIDLSVDGTTRAVLAREVQRDVIRGTILHVDFMAVDLSIKIRATVPVHFINESPAVTARAGNQVNGTSSLEIEALPGDLPEYIEVDLSVLKNVNDSLHVSDLAVSDKVEILAEPDEMIVRIAPLAAEEVEETTAEEGTGAEPEVIGRGKKDEEGEDGEV
jgi:large subunit ribosomal protein L25